MPIKSFDLSLERIVFWTLCHVYGQPVSLA